MFVLILAIYLMVNTVAGIVPPPPRYTSPPPPPLRYTPPKTPYFTTPPPTTMDPSSCFYDGKIFRDGETVEEHRDNCYGMYCEGGSIVAWDSACFLGMTTPCYGNSIKVPGKCCPVCLGTTTPPRTTTTTTTPPPPQGCHVNDTFYEFGADIPQTDPCKHCTCTQDNGVLCSMQSCAPVWCVNPVKKKKQCCATCPQGPNCWYGQRKIKVGDIYKPKPNIECSCPDPYGPLACCRKLPRSKTFLTTKLKRQGKYMNPALKAYIEKYLGL